MELLNFETTEETNKNITQQIVQQLGPHAERPIRERTLRVSNHSYVETSTKKENSSSLYEKNHEQNYKYVYNEVINQFIEIQIEPIATKSKSRVFQKK